MITMFQVMNSQFITVFIVQLDTTQIIHHMVSLTSGNVSQKPQRMIITNMVITKTLRELT